RRSRDNQTVGAKTVDQLPVYPAFQFDDSSQRRLVDHSVIEDAPGCNAVIFAHDLRVEPHARIDPVIAIQNTFEHGEEILYRELRQVAEQSEIDPYDRHFTTGDETRRGQHSPVSSQHDYQVGTLPYITAHGKSDFAVAIEEFAPGLFGKNLYAAPGGPFSHLSNYRP